MDKCVIVIPAYKPTTKLIDIINKLQLEWVAKIVCVDDGSGEETKWIFDEVEKNCDNVCLLRHAVNMGKGRALKTAFNFILNEFANEKVVITVDADGQHTVDAVTHVFEKSLEDRNVILGRREFSNIDSIHEIPLRSRFGNMVTRMVFNYLCNIKISDTQTGLRAIPMEIVPELIQVAGDRYEYETNCLLWCKENGITLEEVKIDTIYENGNDSSHFNPLIDSAKIYLVILKYMCSSILSVVIDYAVFFILASYTKDVFLLTYSGRVCASIVNFIVNKKVVFKTKGKVVWQAVKYFLLVLLSGTVSAIAVSVFQTFIDDNLFIAKILVEAVLFFFNFYIQKNMIFVKKEKAKNER